MTVDIVFSLNKSIIVGLLAAINSISENAVNPEELRFNVIVPVGELECFQQQLDRAFPNPKFSLRVQDYVPPRHIQEFIESKYGPLKPDRRNALHMLYSRLYMKDIFPDISKVIYLDVDLIVLEDISKLFHSLSFSKDRYFAAVPNISCALLHFSKPWLARKEWSQIDKPFNAGVFCTDLSFWTVETYQLLQYYLDWEKQNNYRLYLLNDETILNLMFKNYVQLDRSWNCYGYGNSRLVTWLLKRDLQGVNILHWSGGHHKPWTTKNISFGSIWRKYAIAVS